MRKLLLGIDVGGTNIKAVAMDGEFHVLARRQWPTQTPDVPDVTQNILTAASALLAEAGGAPEQLAAIGVDFPGMVDSREKCVVRLTPLQWENVHIAHRIQALYPEAKVSVDNDGTAGLLGEKYFGAARGHDNVVMLVLGTGIGGAIMTGGHILSGWKNVAGEVGHMAVHDEGPVCSCGKRGCLQTYASARAVVTRAKELLPQHPESRAWDLCGGQLTRFTAKTLHEGLSLGDPFCQDICRYAIRHLAVGVSNYICIFNPSLVVIGGGLSNLGDFLMTPLRDEVLRHGLMHPRQICAIERAVLNEWAGAYGCCVSAAREAGLPLPNE